MIAQCATASVGLVSVIVRDRAHCTCVLPKAISGVEISRYGEVTSAVSGNGWTEPLANVTRSSELTDHWWARCAA